jgi:hypothetical protein
VQDLALVLVPLGHGLLVEERRQSQKLLGSRGSLGLLFAISTPMNSHVSVKLEAGLAHNLAPWECKLERTDLSEDARV